MSTADREENSSRAASNDPNDPNEATASADSRPPGVQILPREARRLQEIPAELLQEITTLAARRTQMRGHDYMQSDDINWAVSRLIVGERPRVWAIVFSTVGALLAGAGIPIIADLFIGEPVSTAASAAWGFGLLTPGLVLLTLGLVKSSRDR